MLCAGFEHLPRLNIWLGLEFYLIWDYMCLSCWIQWQRGLILLAFWSNFRQLNIRLHHSGAVSFDTKLLLLSLHTHMRSIELGPIILFVWLIIFLETSPDGSWWSHGKVFSGGNVEIWQGWGWIDVKVIPSIPSGKSHFVALDIVRYINTPWI